jgi:hypothetical protein
MTLLKFRFDYRRVDGINRTTGETFQRFYPFLPCKLGHGGRTTAPTEGLLDSGSDGVVLPIEVARYLKLELEEASPMQVVGRADIKRYVSRATLTLGRAGRYCSPIRDVEVSVPAEGDTPIILGRKPVFELYRVTFVEAERRFEMDPYRQATR